MIDNETAGSYSPCLRRPLDRNAAGRITLVKPRRSAPGRRWAIRLCKPLLLLVMGGVCGACLQHPVAGSGAGGAVAEKVTAGRQASVPVWVVVKPGDTLWALADRYGDQGQPIFAAIEAMERWNHLADTDMLRPGQRLRVR
jgi:hypothetical protein